MLLIVAPLQWPYDNFDFLKIFCLQFYYKHMVYLFSMIIDGQLIGGNDQYLFIGSEKLTQNGELLRVLETK